MNINELLADAQLELRKLCEEVDKRTGGDDTTKGAKKTIHNIGLVLTAGTEKNRFLVEVIPQGDLRIDDEFWGAERWSIVIERPEPHRDSFDAAEIIDDSGGTDHVYECFEEVVLCRKRGPEVLS